MLSPFLISSPKTPLSHPLPLLTNLPTPASLSWHSPTLGHQSFIGPRAPPLIDVPQGHPLLHMWLEPWVLPCVGFLVGGLDPMSSGWLILLFFLPLGLQTPSTPLVLSLTPPLETL